MVLIIFSYNISNLDLYFKYFVCYYLGFPVAYLVYEHI